MCMICVGVMGVSVLEALTGGAAVADDATVAMAAASPVVVESVAPVYDRILRFDLNGLPIID